MGGRGVVGIRVSRAGGARGTGRKPLLGEKVATEVEMEWEPEVRLACVAYRG